MRIFLFYVHTFYDSTEGRHRDRRFFQDIDTFYEDISTDDNSTLTGFLSSGSNSTLSRRDTMRVIDYKIRYFSYLQVYMSCFISVTY